ncbi:MAG: AAA family ATPase [Candidatus Shapirobacteria bacterium]|jgi:predicted ATP-dependent endonuclease of OLD family
MILLSISIKNFRSIEDVTFKIAKIDGTNTFTLIGINESGKSSFLRAVSLIDNNDEKVLFPKDFFDENKPIEIALNYQLDASEKKELNSVLVEKGFGKEIASQVKIETIAVCVTIDPVLNAQKNTFDRIIFQENIFSEYTLQDTKPVKKDPQLNQEDFDVQKYFESYLPKYFWRISHNTIFWKSDSKHLINEQINLDTFANDPEATSIPLINCFELAGIGRDSIPAQILSLKTSPAEVNNLQEKLGDKTTAHIKSVWPNHPVKIKFQIDNSLLSFLVEDEKVKYKSKTTDQRSDGFRQLISFLLTISAENAIGQLSNSLLLLDEPETHLHPQAQEYLREELIRITRNNENNIVFFATHSNYLIDKEHIERCFRVSKQLNRKTKLEKIELGKTSYSEVNYEVFSIPSTDYHNELYGYLEDEEKSKLDSLPKTKNWFNTKKNSTESVSLATYIRHSIHHPENTRNPKFTADELQGSITILRELKYGKADKTVAKTSKNNSL